MMEKQHCCDEKIPSIKKALGSKKTAVAMHPDHSAEKKRLNRIRGQVDGIERMINDRRYCVEIIQQIKAAKSALSSLENKVLEAHLRGCVRGAFSAKNPLDAEEKIREILNILS